MPTFENVQKMQPGYTEHELDFAIHYLLLYLLGLFFLSFEQGSRSTMERDSLSCLRNFKCETMATLLQIFTRHYYMGVLL